MERDILSIINTLPHRYPFLLVDRILELTEETVTGLKNVTINEPFFQGHFPGSPIMPGVLIIEAMAQVGAVLGYKITGRDKDTQVYFLGLDKVRFRRRVEPGDQLIFRLKLLRRRGFFLKMKGKAFVDGHLVAEAELLASIAEPLLGSKKLRETTSTSDR